MQKLLDFLIRKRHWLLFIFCEVISLIFVFQYNAYQRNVFLNSANVVSGSLLSVSSSVTSYLNLRNENRILFEQNNRLALDNLQLKLQLEAMKAELLPYDPVMTDSVFNTYDYITAEVVNKSVSRLLNHITINKGFKDGIRPEMGVISSHGIVGKVTHVQDRFSVVIPLLNPKWKLSCKLYNSNYDGLLVWDGRDEQYSNMEELPIHTQFHTGDTVVTNGSSAVFPPGIIVGTVVESHNTGTSGLLSLKIKLSTDFRRLTSVRVVKNSFQNEQLQVEQEARKND
ncbi:MAG: rod shape-determining protein MreC [Clostridiales bacterium]|jgi:rod shape-determining protein MreC|nr:rod shape-determining protein MreC [Clostridiales bacterium]